MSTEILVKKPQEKPLVLLRAEDKGKTDMNLESKLRSEAFSKRLEEVRKAAHDQKGESSVVMWNWITVWGRN